jgi:ATP-dependent helicase/nuclease subunit A
MKLSNEMIFASAGSGKTHELTLRFLRLMALGVAPERIAALTFTRRAAGEFFGSIAGRLASAAEEKGEAARLASELGLGDRSNDEFLQLLRRLLESLHRLNLGTLDGFFARVVRAFPLELGLSGEPVILDDREAAEAMRTVFGGLFSGKRSSKEQAAFVEAFRLATFGTEGKSVERRLDDFVADYLELYRRAPEGSHWGMRERIWPGGFPWRVCSNATLERHMGALQDWLGGAEVTESARERWNGFLRCVRVWSPGEPLPPALKYVLEKCLESLSSLSRGDSDVAFNKSRQPLSPTAARALAAICERVVALEIGRRLAQTAGIGRVLEVFDSRYHAAVRHRGRLTFADLQQLLLEGGHLDLEYRLDARLDHWLFDEFQDTSYRQWKILEPLVDEVVQDPAGRRSLFFVGDAKQAIFTWREGDPMLFRHVCRHYGSETGGAVRRRELTRSWRSGPAVIRMVNEVFGNGSAIEGLFPEASATWNGLWQTHESAHEERPGQGALLTAPDEEGRWKVVLDLIREVDPLGRGLTCAILVRRNDTGRRLADFLRQEAAIPAVSDADLRIGGDNPVVAALGALLQWAAHPGDSLAKGHVMMTPLGELIDVDGAKLSRRILETIQEGGFAAWCLEWKERLDGVLPASDAFSRLRLAQLVQAARAFDRQGRWDVDAFLRFLDGYTVREPESTEVIRVMTVHKSKGLGFDLVILPDLEGQKLAQRRDGPAVHHAEDRSVDWILEYPGEVVASADPVLSRYLEEARSEACYEQLSLLYVALTRAKHATYAVVEAAKRSKSQNFPRLLRETLGEEEKEIGVGGLKLRGLWSSGEADWFRLVPSRKAEGPAGEPPPVAPLAGVPVAEPRARNPSGEFAGRLDAGALFTGPERADFGAAVHALLSEIGWIEDFSQGGLADLGARWSGDPAVSACAMEALRNPRFRAVWQRPTGRADLWRETAFEAILDGDWISGRFDRVVIHRDATGVPIQARLYDFKTGVRGSPGGSHFGQLQLYSGALGSLLGLAPECVTADAVYVQSGDLERMVAR